MRRVAVIAHTADRLGMLGAFLRSMETFPALRGWKVVLVGQGYDAASSAALKALPAASVLDDAVLMGRKLGPHSAKVLAFNRWQADLWMSLDDDMEFRSETDYSGAEGKALEKGVGFVSTSSATCDTFLKRDFAKLRERGLVERKLVCTGGGMLFSDRVCDLVRAMPDRQYLFDDVEWPLRAYIAGLTNFRDYRSWCIHTTGRAGGRNGWFEQKVRVVPDPLLVVCPRTARVKNPRLAEENRVRYPSDSDVTALATEMHNRAKLAKE